MCSRSATHLERPVSTELVLCSAHTRLIPRTHLRSRVCDGLLGNPKGVIITHRNIVAGLSAIDERNAPEERSNDEVMISYLPLAHIYERAVQASLIWQMGQCEPQWRAMHYYCLDLAGRRSG